MNSDDREVSLAIRRDPCHATPRDRVLGHTLKGILRNTQEPAAQPIAAWLGIPIGRRALLEILRGRHTEQPWLTLRLQTPATTLVLPNLWAGNVTARLVAACRRALADGSLPRLLGLDGCRVDSTRVLNAWEASLMPHRDAALVAVGCLHWRPPMPASVDLRLPRHLATSPGRGKTRKPIRWLRLRHTIRTLRRWADGRIFRAWTHANAFAFIRRQAQADADPLEAAAIHALLAIYGARHSPSGYRQVDDVTAERQARALYRVLDALDAQCNGRHKQAARLAAKFRAPERFALGALRRAIAELGTPSLPVIAIPGKTRTHMHAPPLLNPSITFSRFRLLAPPPIHLTDLTAAARRFARCVLLLCGRRARCLFGIRPHHFRQIQNPITDQLLTELSIPDSKGSTSSDLIPLPLHALWPSHEIDLAKRFFAAWKDSDVHHNETLLELIVGKPIDEGTDTGRRYELLRKALSRGGRRIRLHEGRREWATWWLVRCLCAQHRELLALPALRPLSACPWFSAEALDRIATLVAPGEQPIEIARRLLGHASPKEYFLSYCRVWPLLYSIHSWLAYQRGEAPIHHRWLASP
jgi:hypothetical protein